MSFFISRPYLRGLSSVEKDGRPHFSIQVPTESTIEPEIPVFFISIDIVNP